jgi:hypothetical protein
MCDPTDTTPIQVNGRRLAITKYFLQQACERQKLLGYIWQNPEWKLLEDGSVALSAQMDE